MADDEDVVCRSEKIDVAHKTSNMPCGTHNCGEFTDTAFCDHHDTHIQKHSNKHSTCSTKQPLPPSAACSSSTEQEVTMGNCCDADVS